MVTHAPETSRELAISWAAVLGRLEVEVNAANFAMWFKGSRAVRMEGSTLVVAASSERVLTWLNERMTMMVERALEQSFPAGTRVRFIGPGTDETLPLSAEDEPARHAGYVIGTVNCEYTFEEFVPAENNRLAMQACLDVAYQREFRFSPLVIYGNPGMGKSHLLHAVACTAQASGQGVACLTAEAFANRFMGAMRAKRMPEFQAEMRGVNLLIIDDLQQLTGMPGTQNELVYTMDEILNAGGSIVVASEKDPMELDLVDRLVSRLSMGLTLTVGPFAHAERREFVERQTRRRRIALPSWAVTRLANCEAPSVRLLMGAVNAAIALEATKRLDVASLDMSVARAAINDFRSGGTSETDVIERIARHFAVNLEELRGRSNEQPVKDARAVAVAVLMARGMTLKQIALEFDGRDKSSLSVLARKGRELLDSNEGLRGLVA